MAEFTEKQKRAVTESGNIIVSAGAGSGKTTVMISRIIEKLKRGARLGQMLIVTFTRASAADMRIKLAEKLGELKKDHAYAKTARQAENDLSICNIGTLHSYCQRLIKKYFAAAELDPTVAVCEEAEARAMLRSSATDAVAAALGTSDEFDAVYDMLITRRSDDNAVDTVAKIADFALSVPDPVRYLTETKSDDEYFAALDDVVLKRKSSLKVKVDALEKDLVAADMPAHVAAVAEIPDYLDGYTDDISSTKHTKRGDHSDILNAEFLVLKKECKAFCTSFMPDVNEAKSTSGAPYVRALKAVAYDAYMRYSERKKRLGLLDYSDLEHGAYRVLRNAECMSEILQNIKYVYIDEFQDVNPLQSAIADRFLDGGAEMFVVGDVKQSIYGFRRCSPAHFSAAVNSGKYKHIALSDNFRSSEQVIDFINNVFCGVMTENFGGAEYDGKDHKLVWGNRSVTGGSAEFVLLQDSDAEKTESVQAETVSVGGEPDTAELEIPRADGIKGYSVIEDASKADDSDAEAAFVAKRVGEWLKTAESPELAKIAVLVRSLGGAFASRLCKEFDRLGIPYGFGRKSSVTSYPDAVNLIDIMRCLDNRFDDIALYTAMRSPMGGFSDAEISKISNAGERAAFGKVEPFAGRGNNARYALWQKLECYDGELKAKLDRFTALRDEMTDFAVTHDAADVLGNITSRTDYFMYLYETGGNAGAVQALIDYATEHPCDMHTFLAYCADPGFDLKVDGGGDCVTVSTVHASKGLEYDYVIVADTARLFNERDKSGRVIVSEDGVFVKVPDAESGKLVKTAPWMVQNAMYPDRTRAEELRLLYVALTRAKKKLTVCGKDKKFSQAVEPCDAKRPLDFMRNITPLRECAQQNAVDVGEVDPPVSESIVSAVTERIEAVRAYADIRAARCERTCSSGEREEIPLKTGVTSVIAERERESAQELEEFRAVTVTDDDRTSGSVDARLRGTAYHRAMELVDLSAPNIADLKERCENFELVEGDRIVTAANVMRGILAGGYAVKERYFIADLSTETVYGNGAPRDTSVLVQGIIDMMAIHQDNSVTIVDYKTGDPAAIASNAGYRTQLKLYAAAVQKAAPELKVTRLCLYSFAANAVLVDIKP